MKKQWAGEQQISVIGNGGWGTTLAVHLNRKGHQVMLWGPFIEEIDEMRETRKNPKFAPDITLPKRLALTADLNEAFDFADIILIAVPSQYLKNTLKQIKRLDYRKKIFISAVKGIEVKGFQTMSEVMVGELGQIAFAVLSGPTIASEVAKGLPTTAVIASKNKNLRDGLQHVFHDEHFRIYTNPDVKGVELGGSLKNVIALACGICDGLGFGTNAKAAILSRGLAEMARLGKALKAKPNTFVGLTGLGDLTTTCFSLKSRNRCVGERLGKGEKIKDILKSMDMVVEGVGTAQAAYLLSRRVNVSMPITESIYQILYRRKSPKDAVAALMERHLKPE